MDAMVVDVYGMDVMNVEDEDVVDGVVVRNFVVVRVMVLDRVNGGRHDGFAVVLVVVENDDEYTVVAVAHDHDDLHPLAP